MTLLTRELIGRPARRVNALDQIPASAPRIGEANTDRAAYAKASCISAEVLAARGQTPVGARAAPLVALHSSYLCSDVGRSERQQRTWIQLLADARGRRASLSSAAASTCLLSRGSDTVSSHRGNRRSGRRTRSDIRRLTGRAIADPGSRCRVGRGTEASRHASIARRRVGTSAPVAYADANEGSLEHGEKLRSSPARGIPASASRFALATRSDGGWRRRSRPFGAVNSPGRGFPLAG
jgi:hypothetical protein